MMQRFVLFQTLCDVYAALVENAVVRDVEVGERVVLFEHVSHCECAVRRQTVHRQVQ